MKGANGCPPGKLGAVDGDRDDDGAVKDWGRRSGNPNKPDDVMPVDGLGCRECGSREDDA